MSQEIQPRWDKGQMPRLYGSSVWPKGWICVQVLEEIEKIEWGMLR